MRFEQALQAMREGKKVKSSTTVFPLFITEYCNGFGEKYKAICRRDGRGCIYYYTITHNELFAEDWEVVEDECV